MRSQKQAFGSAKAGAKSSSQYGAQAGAQAPARTAAQPAGQKAAKLEACEGGVCYGSKKPATGKGATHK
jgi:hypothetical protein